MMTETSGTSLTIAETSGTIMGIGGYITMINKTVGQLYLDMVNLNSGDPPGPDFLS